MSAKNITSSCLPISQAMAELIKPENQLELFLPVIMDESDSWVAQRLEKKVDHRSFYYKAPSKIKDFWVMYAEIENQYEHETGDDNGSFLHRTEEVKLCSGEPCFQISPYAPGGAGPTLELHGVITHFKIQFYGKKMMEVESVIMPRPWVIDLKEVFFTSLQAQIAFNSALLLSSDE